jgi:hypothetical protein
MKIEEFEDYKGAGFIVGRSGRYFSFYVDGTGSSWTKYPDQACRFATRDRAETCVATIKNRERLRRESRKALQESQPQS